MVGREKGRKSAGKPGMDRHERLAAEMRANLKKRRALAKARAAKTADTDADEPPS